MSQFFDTKIEFLKGIGPQKASLLGKDFGIFTFGDFIQIFPFRYEDKTQFYKINQLKTDLPNVQVRGRIVNAATSGVGHKERLNVKFRDETGEVELIWFKGVNWVKKNIIVGQEYVIFGKPAAFGNKLNFAHPDIEPYQEQKSGTGFLSPVYHTSETMKKRFLDSKGIARAMQVLLPKAIPEIEETLPEYLLSKYGLIGKKESMANIHFPSDTKMLNKATARLKFEELFYIQLKLLSEKGLRRDTNPGLIFKKLETLTRFYKEILPFDLTGAQKRVLREIRQDVLDGKQMNRLLQGDVGSGKTIVAFICMLMAVDSEAQTCLMAPTEILSEQHYAGLKDFCATLDIGLALLTGSSKKSERKRIDEGLQDGSIQILIGTHALLEDKVQFKNLGFCVIDEQHRFGVAQRAKLWGKNEKTPPHILVMTATPIPRTLAMTVYGDLDVSIIDELPAGRKEIETYHKFESSRLRVYGMIKEQVQKGHQCYVVFPLIEESETLELKNLMDGYHDIVRNFPDNHVSIVHGKLSPAQKEAEMQRFIKKETQIMVATTVIEVGVNVPNATIMVIENAERFGLAQLHQLRGRVGRGGSQSYCVLVTTNKLSKDGRIRMETMVRTTNGFEIADVDLKLRGPGDLSGTQQSGVLDLKLANIVQDGAILAEARKSAEKILEADFELNHSHNAVLKYHLDKMRSNSVDWGLIS